MLAGKGFKLHEHLFWIRKQLLFFALYSAVPVIIYHYFETEWVTLPWQPISLIGIITAFFLGFRNNSSYERSWEARKIWGGIVNVSRSFTVQTRDYITNEFNSNPIGEKELWNIHKTVVHRHVAWLHAMTYELRGKRDWENNKKDDVKYRNKYKTILSEDKFEGIRPYLSDVEFKYIMSKRNRSSHILSLQSKHLKELKKSNLLDDFRHTAMGNLITEMFSLQGKSERIKNYPIPAGYTTVTNYFTFVFTLLVPFGMLYAFAEFSNKIYFWLAIPFSTMVCWVFYAAKMVGQYTEHPFEGLYAEIPINQIATDIEIDIRQMLDEIELPEPIKAIGPYKMLH